MYLEMRSYEIFCENIQLSIGIVSWSVNVRRIPVLGTTAEIVYDLKWIGDGCYLVLDTKEAPLFACDYRTMW